MHSAATAFCQSVIPCCQRSAARSISSVWSGHWQSTKCSSTADSRSRAYWNAASWAGSTLKYLEQSLGGCSVAIRADKYHYLHDSGSRSIDRHRKDQLVESCDVDDSRVQSESSDPEFSSGSDVQAIFNSQIHGSLKFALLLGLLIFQGSSQAIAAEFAPATQITSFLGDLGDISTGFASAFLLIFFSELGDKTFFIAALLAARNSGAIVFAGTFAALATMTIISVVLGRTFHYVDGILPFRLGETDLPVDDIAAVCLLVYFGVTTLIEAASDDSSKATEEQKEAELAVSEFSGNGAGILAAANTVISTFALVFVAEWGDKSFFSTIALAAASSPLGVVAGALAGHAVATLLAVVGGSILGTYFSEKVISYVGGSLFLVFAMVTLIEIFT